MPYARLSGKEFRELRLAIGWSQQQLAHYFGINYRTVGRWELDKTRIPRVYELALRQMLATKLTLNQEPLPDVLFSRHRIKRKPK